MKLVVQRVSHASVEVDGEITGKIEEGLMVLVGFGENDNLWRIAGYGLPIEDDQNASKGLKEYQKFYDIFFRLP